MSTRHDAATKRLALRMLGAGEAYDLVTARTGASRRTLQYWAKAAGLPPRSSGVPRVPARVRVLAARLYGAGAPMRQCCARTGLSPQAVRRAALVLEQQADRVVPVEYR